MWISGFPDVPDNLANYIPPPDGSKHAAVNAIRMGANNVYPPIGAYVFDAFDQQSISRLAEGDYVPGRWWNKQKGDFANQHKIPLSILRG